MEHDATQSKILRELYVLHSATTSGGKRISVTDLARKIGVSARIVAVTCNDLILRGQVVGDGNLMGFVWLSDTGVADYEAMIEQD